MNSLHHVKYMYMYVSMCVDLITYAYTPVKGSYDYS